MWLTWGICPEGIRGMKKELIKAIIAVGLVAVFCVLYGMLPKGGEPIEQNYIPTAAEFLATAREQGHVIESAIEEEKRLREQEKALENEIEEIPTEEVIEEEPEEVYEEPIYYEEEANEEPVYEEVYYTPPTGGGCLTPEGGVYWFGDQRETWYNMDISDIIYMAEYNGIEGYYWVREDGCRMWGDYIIVACNRDVHPYGSLVETSLGTGISLDTGGFAEVWPYGVDIAVTW